MLQNLFTLLVLSCNQLNHLSYASQLTNLRNYSFSCGGLLDRCLNQSGETFEKRWSEIIFFNCWQDCPGCSVAVMSDRNRPVSQTAVYIHTFHNLSTHQKLDLRSWHFGDISVREYIENDFWDALHCYPGSKWIFAILTYSTKWQLGSKLQKCELDCNCSKHQYFNNKLYYYNKVIIWLQLLLIILCSFLKMVAKF